MTDRPRGTGTPWTRNSSRSAWRPPAGTSPRSARALRASRLRLREQEAAVSARSDRALARVLRARGQVVEPPVPTHPPEWLVEPTDPV